MRTTPEAPRLRSFAAVLAFCAVTVAVAQTTPPPSAPVPAVSGPIAVTQDSHIYQAAFDARAPLNLPAFGYVEEEFFFSGKANVYDWLKNGEVSVRTANAPYNTRMLVRRPGDPKRFSGTVWVELLNPVSMTDMSLAWGYANYYMLDRGDAYIGISAAGDSLKTLKKFDAQRYASLSMANPAPLPQGCAVAGKDYSAETEDGLRWDMLSQAGTLLKSNVPGRPLASLNVQQVYLFGQNNGDTPTYINAFSKHAKLTNGKPVWDGYLLKDSGVPMRTHQCDERPTQNDARRVVRNLGAPMVFVVTENTIPNNFGSLREDSDAPDDRYRRYEIPGSSHVDNAVMPWLPKPAIMSAVGINPQWPEQQYCLPRQEASDFPIHYYVAGAMQNLDEWVRKGTTPPRAQRIQITGAETKTPAVVSDQYGNGLGGIRNAYVEVPTAAYNQRGACGSTQQKQAFTWERLQAIYGSFESYQVKFRAAVDRDAQQRWVPAAYAERMKAGLITMPTLERQRVVDKLATRDGQLEITTLGHAALMFRYGGKVIHVDPVTVFTGDLSDQPKADLILVTHEHADHLDKDAIRLLSKPGTQVVVSRSTAAALPSATVLQNGESGIYAGVKVEAIPSYNLNHVGSSGRLQHAPGEGNSYLITFGDKRVVIGGDGGVVPELNALRNIDIAFLPMNLPPDRTAAIMVDTVKAMKPRVLYPHHYGDVGPWEAVRLLQALSGTEVRIRDMR